MNTSSCHREASPIEQGTLGSSIYPALFDHAVEQFRQMSNAALDLAVEQNTAVLASYRVALTASSMTGVLLCDLAGQATENCASIQRSVLDMLAKQSTFVVDQLQVCGCYSFTADDQSNSADCSIESDARDEATQDEAQLLPDTLLAKTIVDLFVMQPAAGTGKTGATTHSQGSGEELGAHHRTLKNTEVN
jgi:hypothetical protein